MSILYDLYRSPNLQSDDPNELNYHVRAVNKQTVDPDVLVQHICDRSTFGKGEVLAIFNELTREVTQQLLAGNSVTIPGLGFLSLSLQSTTKANPKTIRAEHVKVKQIEFRAEANLRRAVINGATFERSTTKVHSANLTNEETNTRVKNYLKNHPFITRATLSELCHFAKGMAQNHIKRMVDEGILVNSNTPRNPIYMLKDN